MNFIKKNSIRKDKHKRNLFKNLEVKRIEYKSIIHNISLPKELRFNYVSILNNLKKNTSKVRIQNRCIISGRSKSVHKFCKLSRIQIRKLASNGILPGVLKSSW